MPSTSEKQKKTMCWALSYKNNKNDNVPPDIKKLADSMSKQDLEDFCEQPIEENLIIIHSWLNENIEVELTKHGEERSKERYGLPVGISIETIENIAKKSFDSVKKWLSKFKTFVIFDVKTKINLIVKIIEKGKDYIYKVITVMKKDKFKPYPNDKYIEVFEEYKILGVDETKILPYQLFKYLKN